jgi:hypothetical protein
MSQSMEVFVQSTKKRILIGCFGLLEIATAVLLPKITACGPQTWHWVALTFSLMWFHQGAIFLTVGLWGGFPGWSHAFMPSMLRRIYTRMLKPGAATPAAAPAAAYKWGSPRQVLLVQLAMVPLVGWLATLVSPSGPVFNPSVWLRGAAVGGLLAIVMKHLLKR